MIPDKRIISFYVGIIKHKQSFMLLLSKNMGMNLQAQGTGTAVTRPNETVGYSNLSFKLCGDENQLATDIPTINPLPGRVYYFMLIDKGKKK